MHEMGIAMQIVEIAAASIPEHLKNSRVQGVHLKIGKLSSVVPDSLRFCFDIVSKDSAIAGAVLYIEEIPVTARCKSCDNHWTIDGPAFSCPRCGSGTIELTSGQELDISSIELEEDANGEQESEIA
ncbi:MAG: hydrogenase maturation nickel metallochaperone HypA [Deltaproteobacteria bacterium]|nr:hydrogenase maturation nickel metallochaperone HypA [Deltaproteobacteria bacterium]